MTDPQVVTASTGPADLVRRLSQVADQFGSLLAELRLQTDDWGKTPEQAALHRLMSGDAAADEAIAAGLSFTSARLVVATLPDTQTAIRVIEQLRSDRGAVAIWQPPAQLIVLVRGVPRRAGDDRGHRAAARVAALVVRAAPATSLGVSSPLTTPDQLHAAHAEALDAASFAANDGQQLIFADEHWAQITVQRLARQATRALPIDNPISRLREYDASHGADLARTVGTWLSTNGDTAATAAALSLHPNTLRYRIRRVREIAGLDLDDADVRALTHLLLRPT